MTEIVEVFDPRCYEIITQNAALETIADGFEFIEGVVWHPGKKQIIFSDIVGDTMYRWTKDEGVSVFRKPSHMANGNTYDHHGRLLTCEHATSQLTRTELDGDQIVLVSHYDGKELNSPNDVVVKEDGTIYFTDPNYGRRPRVGVERDQEQPLQGVYKLSPNTGECILVADDFENPNGLCFSQDQTHLFVNDSPRQHIRKFDVLADNTLAGGSVWAALEINGTGVADGMKIDSQGNLYCCGPGGIHIYDQDAVKLGMIKMPIQTSNFTWGDEDICSLYICASSMLYKLRVNIPGISLI